MKKILVITGGSVKKLDEFKRASKQINGDFTFASFADLEYFWEKKGDNFSLKIQFTDISEFGLIYIRVVGKRLEDATLVVNYAKKKGIRIVDKLYENALFLPSTISKATELKYLIEGDVKIPPTYFGSLANIRKKAAKLLGFPFVIKSTSGKKARDVWSPKSQKELSDLVDELESREKKGERFIAQKLVRASQRVRVIVVGEHALGAITRPTKWRKRWTKKVEGKYPEGVKEALIPVPKKYAELAIHAAEATMLDIAGVDILEDDETGELYVIESNAAPSWNLVKKDVGVDVESEILKYLVKKL